MAATMTGIATKEIVRRILDGERDFSGTRIGANDARLDAAEGYADMLKYLQGLDMRQEPIVAEGADWRGMRAHGLFFQFAKMSGANLAGADLRGADFRRGDLSGADLRRANLSGASAIVSNLQGANLSDAVLRETDLYEANLRNANLRGADLSRAFLLRLMMEGSDFTGATMANVILYRADLRGAIGLDRTRDLGTATFSRTIVTRKEHEIVQQAMNDRPLFDLRDE